MASSSGTPVASTADVVNIKLDEEEQTEVLRRIRTTNDDVRQASIRVDPAYPANKRFLESCRDRASGKKARGPNDSPDGMSQNVEMARLKSDNAASQQAMKTARDALFAAAVKNKHGAITAIPVAARPTTGLGWLAGEVSKSWTNAVKHADDRTAQAQALSNVGAVLKQAMGSDGIARPGVAASAPATTQSIQQDLQTYIQGMRSKYTGKCGDLQRMQQHSDMIAKDRDSQVAMLKNANAALDASKKRVAELEAAAGLSGMASGSAAAAGSSSSAPAAASAGPTIAPIVIAAALTQEQARETLRLTGISQASLETAVKKAPSIKPVLSSIISLGGMHESTKMRVLKDIVHSVNPAVMGPQVEDQVVARDKYDEMKTNYRELDKLCKESGLTELTESDASVAPEIKTCIALIKKHGGPDVCSRMIQVQVDQRKALYHTVLSSQSLKPNDVVCCRFMSSGAASAVPMFALGIVQNIPHKDTPGAIHVQSMFQNDGCYESGKRIGFCIPPSPDCYEVVTSRTVRDYFDKVFDINNLNHLYNNANKMNYTSKSKTAYRDTLYTHTTGMLINFMRDKRGFFTQYEQHNLKDPKVAKAAEEQRNAAGRAAAIDLGDD